MTQLFKKPKIVVICGPTGVGKTGFAIQLAQRFSGEIVGADSMQIYRQMDIGTAKPTAEEQAAIRHHMVDIIDPDQDFDAAAYARQAAECLERLAAQCKLPFVVGGTGLYIKALLHGLTASAPSDPRVREELKAALKRNGSAAMHQRLAAADPEAAQHLHPNDGYRILRALEVLEITGRSIRTHHAAHGFAHTHYDALKIGLSLPRESLYARIDLRVERMLSDKLEDEVRTLLDRGYAPSLKSMQSLGYRHMGDYIQGRLEFEEAVRTLQRDHRRYAKRQMTWFRADSQVNWLMPDQFEDAAGLIVTHLKN